MIRLNNLFDLDVTEGDGEFTYSLYLIEDDDEPVIERTTGSDFTSSEESLREMGRSLMYAWGLEHDIVILHAIGIRYRGHFEVKYWTELQARDTSVEFYKALNKPELTGVDSFDFGINKGYYNNDLMCMTQAVVAYGPVLTAEAFKNV
jgi:hypothetical protein